MNNSIYGPLNNQSNTQQSNDIFSLINQVRSSSNPNAAMQTIVNNNPMFQNIMNYIKQNGGDAKTAFYNMAAQKGIDPNSILNQLR